MIFCSIRIKKDSYLHLLMIEFLIFYYDNSPNVKTFQEGHYSFPTQLHAQILPKKLQFLQNSALTFQQKVQRCPQVYQQPQRTSKLFPFLSGLFWKLGIQCSRTKHSPVQIVGKVIHLQKFSEHQSLILLVSKSRMHGMQNVGEIYV